LSAGNSNPKFVNLKNEYMLEKNFSLLFYLKKEKRDVNGQVPVYMRITVDGIRKEISTGMLCDSNRWNCSAGRVLGTKENVKLLNAYLDTLQNKVYEARRQMLERNEIITSEGLKNFIKGKNEKAKMIMVIFQDHNDQMESLVGKDFSPATLERYETSFAHTRSFMEWKYGVSDMDIKQLDYKFVSQYEF
jgi:hypothetical protein